MNAVYLIIAGALLGPIEAPQVESPISGFRGPEPINQTCERAMKEIGATPTLSVSFAEGHDVRQWVVSGMTAICIPAPSGLKP